MHLHVISKTSLGSDIVRFAHRRSLTPEGKDGARSDNGIDISDFDFMAVDSENSWIGRRELLTSSGICSQHVDHAILWAGVSASNIASRNPF